MITNLFNVWLVISVSAFSLMDILFWLNHENSLDLTEIWSWNKKERHSSIVFSDNCCHTSLLSGSSLKVNYKVKSEILSRNLLYSVPLKSMVLHRPLTEPFPPARLCDIRHWSSGRQWVAHPPPDADTSYYIRYASHLLASHVWSGESTNKGKLSSSWWWIQVFPGSNFCWKAHLVSLATNPVNCLPRRNRLTWFILKKMSADTQSERGVCITASK